MFRRRIVVPSEREESKKDFFRRRRQIIADPRHRRYRTTAAAGLFLPDGISPALDSHEICNLGIGQVAEGRRLFPTLTVTENLPCWRALAQK